jgi:hypothetical protein
VQPQEAPPGIMNPNNQLAVFGLQNDDSPLLKMSGADGSSRVRMYLRSDGKPMLIMGDESGSQAALGIGAKRHAGYRRQRLEAHVCSIQDERESECSAKSRIGSDMCGRTDDRSEASEVSL